MRGDLFEVVPGQLFAELSADPPSVVFHRLRQANPAPYGALINLGEGEFLVAASPEMYVRVEGKRIETCPISGTIARGRDPVEDAERIRELLNSAKDESELTMCTDVDRNDKSRVCVPGTVRVIGRRQIELYSRLIHTVDHVEGVLREEFDALDGFLSHAWAVTVTGAPKRWAIRFIEEEERSSRRWYGGAIGRVTFDGNMNTGLTLRTIRMKDGVAEVRAGATLLYDSDPQAEEAETRLKAAAMFTAIRGTTTAPAGRAAAAAEIGKGRRVLLVDHEDSFVHTLANYIRTTGAEVVTMRPDLARAELRAGGYDLVVLSPGTGPALRLRDGRDPRSHCPAAFARVRGLPRPARDRRVFRRLARGARPADARQAVTGPRLRRPAVVRPAERVRRRAVSFIARPTQHIAAGAFGHRGNRGRRRYGARAPTFADRRRAVSPGIGDDLT